MIAGEFASRIVDGVSNKLLRLPDESALIGVLPDRPCDVTSYGADKALILSLLLTRAPCPLGSVPDTILSPDTPHSRSSRLPPSELDLRLDPGPHLIIAFMCPTPAALSLELVSCVVSMPVSIEADVLLIVNVASVSCPFILSNKFTKAPTFLYGR